MPGIARQRNGKGFVYLDPQGRKVRDAATLQRIRSLAIPPAWTDVWICNRPDGHVQAVGRDARGRKQYRYHPRWQEVRDETKFNRMVAFGRALPGIRRRVERHLRLRGLRRRKVLAAVVRLLELTCMRIGNEEYARLNGSFGLTTLRDRHVEIAGSRLEFNFRGKGGKRHYIRLTDRRLARIVQLCQDIPGYELFQYIDKSGTRQPIDSADVNGYLREISGRDFTAKDFRTWSGTVQAVSALMQCGAAASRRDVKRNITLAVNKVAEQLGNTPAICRKCYIHPAVFESYQRGSFAGLLQSAEDNARRHPNGLGLDEKRILEFLRSAERKAGGQEEVWSGALKGPRSKKSRSQSA
jgi:DNA topoisomerase-1